MDTLIEAVNISLQFSASSERRRSLKEWVLDAVRGRIRRKGFKAIDNISFKINRGEAVGLIGRNGAGKSTLLKMVTGIADPTSGKISVRGQVAPLLALGNGLDPTLTGRENIYLNGAILGYTKEYLKAKEESIIEFSELGDFIDTPVRTYSSGMTMRLAFSIATAASPEILILDEVLAVGDSAFQAKCNARISEIIEDGATVFFVSHNLVDIVRLCKRVIWLEKGKIRMDGAISDVVEVYRQETSSKILSSPISAKGTTPIQVHRFYSDSYGEDYHTCNPEEVKVIRAENPNWEYIGVDYQAYSGPLPGTKPLHSFYSKEARCHFLTTDTDELDGLRSEIPLWAYEGISQYVYSDKVAGTIPIYRFRSNLATKFLYTANEEEVENLKKDSSGWSFETIAFWALPK